MLRDINIKSVLNGWIVKVGCQTVAVVFKDVDTMIAALRSYPEDPESAEKCWLENSVNAGKLSGGDVAIDRETSLAHFG